MARRRRPGKTSVKNMTDIEIIQAQQTAIEDLQKRVKKLAKRLREKMRYEADMLVSCGCTPRYIASVAEKDRKALED